MHKRNLCTNDLAICVLRLALPYPGGMAKQLPLPEDNHNLCTNDLTICVLRPDFCNLDYLIKSGHIDSWKYNQSL